MNSRSHGTSDEGRRLMTIDQLPTLAEIQAARAGKPLPKGRSRLEAKAEKDRTDYWREREFKAAVWKRDRGICRVCHVRVLRQLELAPTRGEVHHLESRRNRAVRYDQRNGVLVCATDHERLERSQLFVRGTARQMFEVNGKYYMNADLPLRFESL